MTAALSPGAQRWFASDDVAGRVSAQRKLPAAEAVAALEDETADVGFPHGPLPLRPLLLPPAAYDELFTAARRVLDVLRRTLFHAAATAADRAAALGAGEDVYPSCLFLDDEATEERFSACLARPDAVVGADGLKFVEFNVSGVVGGAVEAQLLTRALRRIYAGGQRAPFAGADPLAARADLYAAVCAQQQVPPSVALVGTLRLGLCGRRRGTSRYFDVELDYVRRRGMTGAYFEPEELLESIGYPGRSRYSVGLRHFAPEEWLESGIDIDPVSQALRSGCLLLGTQTGRMIANKKVLAWASEGGPWLSRADRDVIDAYLPWTRLVREGKTWWRDRQHDLIDLICAQREHFVLKAAMGFSGKQVTIGRDSDSTTWCAAVQAALSRDDAVVQEYVEPQRCRLEVADPPDGEAYEFEATPVLSPFLCGGRRGGCLVRYSPTASTGIISASYGALVSVALAAR